MRVPTFADTLIYEFFLSDFSNEEIAERIDKIIGLDNYKNKTYQTYIEERETELKKVRSFIDDYDNKKIANILTIQLGIEKLKSEIAKFESEVKLKQQEIDQITTQKVPEKEELFRKHFVPVTGIVNNLKNVALIPTKVVAQPTNIKSEKVYKIESAKAGVNARGKYYDSKKFMVLMNSTVSLELDKTFGKGAADGAYDLRMDLEKTGIINGNREFTEDYTFNSISQAACVVLGGSRNGNKEWK
jgi:hypothetical protein